MSLPLPRRGALLGALALPALLGTARAQGRAPLRVAQYKAGDALLLRLAGQAETPYPIAWSEFASGNLMVEAAHAGSIDLAYGSEIPPAFAAASGARIKIVAVIKGDVNEQVVLVPKDSPVRGIADLKGKRVGYVRATTTHFYLNRMLAEAGLSFSDIKAVNLSPSDGRAAFESGALDAWAIYGYSVPLARQAGARVLRTAQGILSGNYLYFARAEALQNPETAAAIADYLARIARGFLWIDDHKAQLAEAQAAQLNLPAQIIRDVLENVSQPRRLHRPDAAAIASHQEVADEFTRLGLLPGKVDVAPLWDLSFGRRLELAA
ncbi:ABC transporter substrate-binding protein [Roseomonas sp. GC11]|uniref:ABC transporter substrate-binding protein n=1 Tax=Roseomonas sp. GC11 TaxID=2950546 RepID=UPI00210BBE09|nr:ABC transporter substrate-binding protein [Roseomonas sp. GC11]MCQ4160096.1 ABC transporter substrate-binding protein [Roseomonas sp. GC11]